MKKRHFLTYFVLIAIILLIYFFLPPQAVNTGRSIATTITKPFSKFFYAVGYRSRNFLSSVSEIGTLRQENINLKEEIFSLRQENSNLSEVKNENQLLRKEIEVKDPNQNFNLLKANIIGREPSTFFESYTVDQGEESGVKVGQAVIYRDTLVGRVTVVTGGSAQIMLVVSSRSIIQAELSESRTLGIVRGGNQGLSLDNIPQDVTFKSGEMVITSGLGGDFPKGIIIGQTSKITSPQSEIFQTFSLTTPLDFNRIEAVFIIK